MNNWILSSDLWTRSRVAIRPTPYPVILLLYTAVLRPKAGGSIVYLWKGIGVAPNWTYIGSMLTTHSWVDSHSQISRFTRLLPYLRDNLIRSFTTLVGSNVNTKRGIFVSHYTYFWTYKYFQLVFITVTIITLRRVMKSVDTDSFSFCWRLTRFPV